MDFKTIKDKIENAVKIAFLEMFEKHGAEEIYAFALYSDEGAMTVCPSTNTAKHLQSISQDEDFLYYKFEPAEWKYEMQGADEYFAEIGNLLRIELEKNEDNDEWFDNFQQELYKTCVDVLLNLKNQNFFEQITKKEIFLYFTVSDYEFKIKEIKNIVNKLNDNQYQKEYLNWMKSWS